MSTIPLRTARPKATALDLGSQASRNASKTRSPKQVCLRLHYGLSPLLWVAPLVCASGGLTGAWAQGVLAPPPPDFAGMPPELRITGPNQPGEMPPIMRPAGANEPLGQIGPVELRPHLLYRFLYGDGVPVRPGENLTTAINELYPGILLNLGSHWAVDYTPVLRFYSNNQFRNATDQAARLDGSAVYREWTFGLSQSYALTSDPLVETGGQTEEAVYSTVLRALYQLSTSTSLELSAHQDFRLMGQNPALPALSDSRRWSTLDWLDYRFGPSLTAGIGAGFGYDSVSPGTDMTFEQPQVRATWRPGEKLSILAAAGVEVRQFLGADVSDAVNPIFGVTASYQLFEATALSLAAARAVAPAYFNNELTVDTTVSGGLRQRLLKHFYLDVRGGYWFTSYSATAGGLDVNRQDNGTFFNVSLNTRFLKRGNAAVFYQYTENSSNEADFTFSGSQVGAELGYHF